MKTRLFLILALAAVATLAPLTGCGGGECKTHYVFINPTSPPIHVGNDFHEATPTPAPTPPAP